MKAFLVLVVALIGLTLLAAMPARAAPQCGQRDAVVAQLVEKYGETLRGMGLSSGGVVEVYASAASGTWTITVTLPTGIMCLVASGQGFETITPAAAGTPL